MTAYDPDNIFAKILRGEIPAYKVYEDDDALAFMDVMPQSDGHTLILPKVPSRNILDDQIVWGRSPARLDLAGGWSDTPPYCLEHGGQVVNIAVDLNGQPPVQAFARVCEAPRIVLHSIDLGISESVETYEDLLKATDLGGFSIARAALRLAGFDPMFHRDGGARTLRDQLLAEFGGLGEVRFQRDEGGDRLALEVVRAADDRGFRHRRVGNQRALDLRGAVTVAGNIEHVVKTADDPEIAVLVAARAVAPARDGERLLGF